LILFINNLTTPDATVIHLLPSYVEECRALATNTMDLYPRINSNHGETTLHWVTCQHVGVGATLHRMCDMHSISGESFQLL